MDIIKQFQAIFKDPQPTKLKLPVGKALDLTAINILKCIQLLTLSGECADLVNTAAFRFVTREVKLNQDGHPVGFKFSPIGYFKVVINEHVNYLKYFQIETEFGSAGFFVNSNREMGRDYKQISSIRPAAVDIRSIKLADANATLIEFVKTCRSELNESVSKEKELKDELNNDIDDMRRAEVELEIASIERANYTRFEAVSEAERFAKKLQVIMQYDKLVPKKQETTLTKILKAVGV